MCFVISILNNTLGMVNQTRAMDVKIFDNVFLFAGSALQAVRKIKIIQSLLGCLSFDSQSTACDVERGSDLVDGLLQNDSQVQRFPNCSGDSVDRNFPAGLFLKEVSEFCRNAYRELQRGGLGH